MSESLCRKCLPERLHTLPSDLSKFGPSDIRIIDTQPQSARHLLHALVAQRALAFFSLLHPPLPSLVMQLGQTRSSRARIFQQL